MQLVQPRTNSTFDYNAITTPDFKGIAGVKQHWIVAERSDLKQEKQRAWQIDATPKRFVVALHDQDGVPSLTIKFQSGASKTVPAFFYPLKQESSTGYGVKKYYEEGKQYEIELKPYELPSGNKADSAVVIEGTLTPRILKHLLLTHQELPDAMFFVVKDPDQATQEILDGFGARPIDKIEWEASTGCLAIHLTALKHESTENFIDSYYASHK